MEFIAEIGNCHFGSLDKAKEMVMAAKDSGATLVKSQIGDPNVFARLGTMGLKFYENAVLSIEEANELIEYGEKIGIKIFYSIFADALEAKLSPKLSHIKISAKQTESLMLAPSPIFIDKIGESDQAFVSIPETIVALPRLARPTVLYASKYCRDPDLEWMKKIAEAYPGRCGHSNHSVAIPAVLNQFKQFNLQAIEKHFVIDRNDAPSGCGHFRDLVHSADPKQFQQLVKMFEE